MKKILVCTLLAALAACGSEQPAPAPEQTATPAPVVTPTMPPPDQESFAAAFAEACPGAKPVNTALCKSQGLGKDGFICEFGLGDDESRRHEADLVPGDGKWTLADPENACAV